MHVDGIDIVFAAVVLLFTVRCVLRGFIEELMTMASAALGLIGAFGFYKTGAGFVRERFMPGSQVFPQIIAFAGIFLIIWAAVKILAYVLKDIFTRINLGGADRVLGGLLGALEGLILVCLALFILTIQPFFDAGPYLEKSFFARHLLPLIGAAEQAIPSLPGRS